MKRLPITDTLLRRRCQRILAEHRRRAASDGKTLNYGLEGILVLASVRQCVYCRMFVAGDFQLDHGIPIARGGTHTLGNLYLACKHCNSAKGKLTSTEFRELLRLIHGWHPTASEDVLRRLVSGSAVYAKSRRAKK